ncbi:MAG: hypothetical protein AB7S38_18310 [Vulcanimicrobiota bacterium]
MSVLRSFIFLFLFILVGCNSGLDRKVNEVLERDAKMIQASLVVEKNDEKMPLRDIAERAADDTDARKALIDELKAFEPSRESAARVEAIELMRAENELLRQKCVLLLSMVTATDKSMPGNSPAACNAYLETMDQFREGLRATTELEAKLRASRPVGENAAWLQTHFEDIENDIRAIRNTWHRLDEMD